MASAQPLDLVTKSLSAIGVAEAGETLEASMANDAFDLLNDMMEQWSNDRMLLYCVQEAILELTASQYVYTIGPGGAVGAAFTGSISGTTLTVTALASGAISVGQTISGTGITTGTTITSLGTALGGNGVNALGTYRLSLSQTVASIAITSAAVRPLRINSALVRVVNSASGTLDYPVAVINLEDYELIGVKTMPGPWPRAVYYQPSEPLGVLNFWPNPSSGEVHLFCDTVLNRFASLSDTIQFPPGYFMALMWSLADYLIPFYPATGAAAETRAKIPGFAKVGRDMIRRSNMAPQQTMRLDSVISARGGRDAGWIMHGGFNR